MATEKNFSTQTKRIKGYEGILISTRIKKALRDFRDQNSLTDSHMERCLVSSIIQTFLDEIQKDQDMLNKVMETLRKTIHDDFEMQIQHENLGESTY